MLKIINLSFRVITFIVILISQPITAEENAPIIQPGAPGELSKNLNAQAATAIADSSYTKADVSFLQGMIVHHQQAIVMSSLAPKRTNPNYFRFSSPYRCFSGRRNQFYGKLVKR